MKTLFADQITPETGKFIDVFQVGDVDRKEKKDRQPYLSMKLRDKTGEVDAKLWVVPADLTVKAGDFLKVEVETQKYRDAVQLKVLRARVLDRAEIALEDFIPASKRDRDGMLDELKDWVYTIDGQRHRHLRDTLLNFILNPVHGIRDRLRDAPAARKLHQAYLGGLLEHVLNMCALVDGICKVYPDLDRDVMVAGVIVHDIGKLWEMAYEDHIGTTRPGNLLGHIIQGSVFWANNTEMLDPVTRDHVAHIIVSHHGCKEWGSPILPMTREAQLVHLVDMIDSKVAIMDGALAGPLDPDGFTSRIHALDTALWNGAPDAAA